MATGLFAVNAPRIYRSVMPAPPSHTAAETALRRYALSLPEASEQFPWGERVIKVRGKIFVFLGLVEDQLRVGVKLPLSSEMALTLPYVEPTGYGLGRSGWITAQIPSGQKPNTDLLKTWIAQSYRAIAPKKLAALVIAKVNP
ncbi:MAG: MmcQ/YjbR family DNA-binding protein [Bauldia sp.]